MAGGNDKAGPHRQVAFRPTMDGILNATLDGRAEK